MCEGLEQGLALIDDLLAREHLSQYHLARSARADMCHRFGRIPESRASYEEALTLAPQASDRRFSRQAACRIKTKINRRRCRLFPFATTIE